MTSEPRSPSPMYFLPRQAALPLKDAMRLVRSNVRRTTQMAGDARTGGAPALPRFLARATDELLTAAETVVRGIVVGDRDARLLRAFPYPPSAYFEAGDTGLSPRQLFVKTHYAIAKHMTRYDTDVGLICETAIDAAYDEARARRAGSSNLVATMTLALIRERPIRRGPFTSGASTGEAGEGDPNRAVFLASGLATQAAGLMQPLDISGEEMLVLSAEVVEARMTNFRAALAAPDPEREVRGLFEALAPLLL